MSRSKINKIKIKILKAAYAGGEGHIGSAFSVVDILYVLYNSSVKISSELINSNDRDYVILSKGHASLAHAAILEDKKIITTEQLMSFCSHDSILGGHLDKNKVPGVEASTGSLGHGISLSVGMAMGVKIKKRSNKIFCVVGDGECNEGTFWEAMLLGAHHNIDNLYCIIDYNRSNDRALKLDSLEDKLNAFGWDVDVIDGHSHSEIDNALSANKSCKPKAIIANTIKGSGIKMMENNHEWHHKVPSFDELKIMIKELS
jgi:transketolase